VVKAEAYVCPGDHVIPLRDATGRIGHVICAGADASQAIQRANDALAQIAVRTRQV